MMNRFRLFVLIYFSAFLGGCSSLNYHANGYESHIYPGTRGDCAGIANAHSTGMYAPWLFGYSVIDMPFSFVVDTLYLPSDIYDVEHHKHQERNPTVETNNIANQIQTNMLWKPTLSPKEMEQWKMLPGPN
jgi:uncharacterized protein YceK